MARAVRERASSTRHPTGAVTRSVLLDTNVILDVILDRTPWAADAVRLLDLVASGRIAGFLAAHAVTTVHYIVQRARGRAAAVTAVADLLELLTVVPLEAADFQRALALNLGDFEDAVQAAACLKVGASFLITRNPRDFRGAPVRLSSAGEVVALMERTTGS